MLVFGAQRAGLYHGGQHPSHPAEAGYIIADSGAALVSSGSVAVRSANPRCPRTPVDRSTNRSGGHWISPTTRSPTSEGDFRLGGGVVAHSVRTLISRAKWLRGLLGFRCRRCVSIARRRCIARHRWSWSMGALQLAGPSFNDGTFPMPPPRSNSSSGAGHTVSGCRRCSFGCSKLRCRRSGSARLAQSPRRRTCRRPLPGGRETRDDRLVGMILFEFYSATGCRRHQHLLADWLTKPGSVGKTDRRDLPFSTTTISPLGPGRSAPYGSVADRFHLPRQSGRPRRPTTTPADRQSVIWAGSTRMATCSSPTAAPTSSSPAVSASAPARSRTL